MILNAQTSYPTTHAYVVKLHRDCDLQTGSMTGRLEHVASGRTFQFSSAQELIECLMRDVATVDADSTQSGS
jgi:hypothetical protein